MDTEQLIKESTKIADRAARAIGGSFKQGVGFEPILASDFEPIEPIRVPEVRPATGAAMFIDELDSRSEIDKQAKEAAQKLVPVNEQQRRTTEVARASLFDRLLGRTGEIERADREYSETVDPAKRELDEIENQIRSKSHAYRRQIERIQDAGGGLVSGQNIEVQRVEREAARELADLLIIKQAKLQNYDTAKAIADRKVAIELEQETKEIDALKFWYEENKEIFDKQEDRRFNLKLSERERLLEEEANQKKFINDIAVEFLREGGDTATAQRIFNAGSEEEALLLTGNRIGSLDRMIKQAQLSKLQTDAAKALKELSEPAKGTGILAQAQAKGNIDLISGLAEDKNLGGAVGPNVFTRISPIGRFTGGKSNFIAGVEQLRSQLSLDSLVNAKERGATFGALSESELQILAASASKIGTWAIKDKDGNIAGYKASEADFRAELDKINNFAKLDYLIKGGDPADVGAEQMEDGTIWTLNSDGTATQLYP